MGHLGGECVTGDGASCDSSSVLEGWIWQAILSRVCVTPGVSSAKRLSWENGSSWNTSYNTSLAHLQFMAYFSRMSSCINLNLILFNWKHRCIVSYHGKVLDYVCFLNLCEIRGVRERELCGRGFPVTRLNVCFHFLNANVEVVNLRTAWTEVTYAMGLCNFSARLCFTCHC